MRRLVLVPALACVLALGACVPGGPSASSTTTPPSTPTHTPTVPPSTPPAAAPPAVAPAIALASISATPDGLTLIATDGSTLVALDYFQPQDAALAALTDALGFAPQQLTRQGTPNSDDVPTDYFDFEGLRVLGPPTEGGPGWSFRIGLDTAAVRGIPVRTTDGLQVGADAPTLESAYAAYARRIGSRLLIAIPGSTGYSASLFADDPAATITSILVPTD